MASAQNLVYPDARINPERAGTEAWQSWEGQVFEDGMLQDGSRPPQDRAAASRIPAPARTVDLHDNLNQLSRLIANVTEAYTAAIFLANAEEKFVQLTAVHTLSREIVPAAQIGYGCGLVGWTAQNAVRISVCPFEHDASTLLYYTVDQDLKSFIAVPIIGLQGELWGVISCDSKKSYAFAKVTEKILIDCAAQASALIAVHRQLAGAEKQSAPPDDARLLEFLEVLRSQRTERELLEKAADMPLEFVDRDALVVITVDEPGAAAAAFYSPTNQVRVGHRLLEHVCRHKRVICGERNVQAQTVDDNKQRSFLSIPFHISKREAGSINLLSRAFEAFSAPEIATLERVAKIIGRELELVRLRSKYTSPEMQTGLMTWEQFSRLAANAFPDPSKVSSDKSARNAYTLIRLSVPKVSELEDFLGASAARKILLKLMRLVEQAKGSQAIACSLYGSQMLILSERAEGERIWGRLDRLIARFNASDENAFEAAAFGGLKREAVKSQPGANVNDLVKHNLQLVKVESPRDGETLDELMAKSNRLIEERLSSGRTGLQAGNW